MEKRIWIGIIFIIGMLMVFAAVGGFTLGRLQVIQDSVDAVLLENCERRQ